MSELVNPNTGEIITFEQRHNKLLEWSLAMQAIEEAKAAIAKEQALRKEVADLFFFTPTEGVNTFELEQGYKLKLTYKIDRKIDEAALDAVRKQLAEDKINIDTLLSYKPSLDTKAYKGLMQVNPEAAKVFDQALTIKPASPTLELVAPKS